MWLSIEVVRNYCVSNLLILEAAITRIRKKNLFLCLVHRAANTCIVTNASCHLVVESDTSKKTKKSVTAVDTSPISVKEVTETTASLLKSPPPSSSIPSLSTPHSNLLGHPVFNELESVPTTEATEATEEMPVELSKIRLDEESYSSLTCSYRQICDRFLNTLSLPGNNQ